MSLFLSTPLSLYSIPVVWFTTFYPMNMKFGLINKTRKGGYDNLKPRENTQAMINDLSIPPEVSARAARLEGAHLNGNEMLPLWIGAVIVGNMAGVPQKTLNVFSASFIAARVLYNYVYTNQSTPAQSWFRTAVFFTSLSMPLTLLVKAANKVRAQH